MQSMRTVLQEEIFPYLPLHLQSMLAAVPETVLDALTEIRLRAGQPLLLVMPGGDCFAGVGGAVSTQGRLAYFCTEEDVVRVVQAVSRNSIYALEEELRRGYITLDGGHRIGLAGRTVIEQGEIKALKDFSSLNIRLARQVKGCAEQLLPYLFDDAMRLQNLLLIAPPRCGKTTLLRDLARLLSCGGKDFPGMQVGVVDERSEIASCKNGCVSGELGWRVDVLDGCPKACGMLMLIRSMAPQVIVTDEIGRAEDVTALEEALHAGVRVIASVHGETMEDLRRRPQVNLLIQADYFDRYVFLTDRPKIGAIREVLSSYHQGERRRGG